jgi:UDP-glucose 4-epimerase
LIEQAVSSGARQFVLISSLSAVSDNSSSVPINEQTLPEPSSSYGRSKLAGESHMVMFEGRDRTAITLRPPIVYGAGAQGNWLLLQRLAATGVPLPFGSINNCRTLIAAENLVDAIFHVVSAREPTTGTFLVSDGESISLREILTWLRRGMGIPPRLVPIPSSALNALLRAVGRERIAKSLLGDLQVDSSLFGNTFGWAPQLHPSEAIVRSGAGFQR